MKPTTFDSPAQLRDFLETEYKKKGLWSSWQEIVDHYRQCGMDDYVNELIQVLELDEVLEKCTQE